MFCKSQCVIKKERKTNKRHKNKNRYTGWDCLNCNNDCTHDTCSNPNRCALFGNDCGFDARADAFVNQNKEIVDGEGFCGANMCYTS